MKLLSLIKLSLCMGICVAGCHGQSALSRYIYASNWSPVTDHATDIAPGLIIAVNLKDGSWEPVDLQDDEKGIPLDTFTATLDQAQFATYTDKASAQRDLRLLFGPETLVGLPNDGTIEFSGVELTVSRLENGRQKQLFNNHSSPTYNTIREWYNGKRVALLLVTQVGSASSIQIRFGRQLGDGAAGSGLCSDRTRAASDPGETVTHDAAPKSVAEFRAAERSHIPSGMVQAKTCHSETAQQITFNSKTPIPVAMKVKLITSYRNGTVDTDYGERPLAFFDRVALMEQCKKMIKEAY